MVLTGMTILLIGLAGQEGHAIQASNPELSQAAQAIAAHPHPLVRSVAGHSPTQVSQQVGQFRVDYAPVENQDYTELRQAIQSTRLYEEMAEVLNQTFSLPVDVTITPATCGTANAFYDPQERRIVMCDEILGYFAQLFAPHIQSEQDFGESVVYSNLFVFFHELGHGLIDIYDLPTVGREEDAVDEFSTLLLLDAGEEGEKAVLKAAHWFALQSDQNSDDDPVFWDEHSLDMQRFFNIACLMYGKDPKKFSDLVTAEVLPESRASSCPAEYSKKYRSWETLLAPYVKP
jgi:hypothetical protein